jgi:hypothetical protein
MSIEAPVRTLTGLRAVKGDCAIRLLAEFASLGAGIARSSVWLELFGNGTPAPGPTAEEPLLCDAADD